MTKITTDFTGTETLAVTKSRLTEILEYYGYDPDAFTTWGDAREALNELLGPTSSGAIAATERASVFRPKVNLVNDPDALFGAMFTDDTAQRFAISPDTVFTDEAGTAAADFGDTVAALRDPAGDIVATQATSAARPTYGRHPASGIRNRLPNSGTGAVAGALDGAGALPSGFFLTNIATSAATISNVTNEGFDIRLNGTPTGSVVLGTVPIASAPSTAVGQTWTASAYIQMVGGDTTNITSAVLQFNGGNSSNAIVENFPSASFLSTISDNLRREASFTWTNADVVRSRTSLLISWTSGAIDITLRIRTIQHEQAASASAPQVVRSSGFDVTEDGQRSVYYLAPDGMDDWMALAAAFTPVGAYTLAAAVDVQSGATERKIFGNSASTTAEFFATGSFIVSQPNTSANRIFAANTAGRIVAVARHESAASAQIWRNGAAPTTTITGNATPMNAAGINALFRRDAVFTAPTRFYGGVLIDRAITEAERQMLQLYLASKGGIAL